MKRESRIFLNSQGFLNWLLASRVKTLSATIAPISVSGAWAFYKDVFHLMAFATCVFCSFCIQIATNFINDAADFQRGADTSKRLGPPRAAQLGLISPRQLYQAGGGLLFIAFCSGLYLVYRGGFPILIVGLFSLLFAVLYTKGSYALAYNGLGDLFAFIFFGIFSVCGTFYVQSYFLSLDVLILSVVMGLLVVSLIAVNNTRDIPTDKEANKKTLSVCMGERASKLYYSLVLVLPYVFYLFFIFRLDFHFFLLAPFICLIFSIKNICSFYKAKSAGEYNVSLEKTSLHLLAFSFLVVISLIFARLV